MLSIKSVMERITAIDVIESRFGKINSSLDLVLDNYDAEDIHHFRVETKKLKAFLHMLALGLNDAHSFKLPAEIRRFYKAIGIVRSLQLQHDKFKKIAAETDDHLPSQYMSELDTEEKANIAKAKKLIKSKEPFRKEKEHLISVLMKGGDEIKVNLFLKSAVRSLKRHLISEHLTDETLHAVRKILKDILYTQPFIEVKINTTLPSIFSDQANLKLVSTLLGDFQDIYTGSKLLQEYSTDGLPEPELIFLKNVEKEWKEEKKEIRKRIMDQLKATGSIPDIHWQKKSDDSVIKPT